MMFQMVQTMIAMNRQIGAYVAEATPEQRDDLLALCSGFIRACDETTGNMQRQIALLTGWNEPLPVADCDDFESSVLRDLATLP